MTSAPVIFERRGLGREVALLGAVEVGEVVEVAGDRRARAWWRTSLPGDPRGPIGVTSAEAARMALIDHVWEWMERAGVALTRSQTRAASR